MVAEGVAIGAAGAAVLLEHAIPAVNSVTFVVIVRNILANVVTRWATWLPVVSLLLRH